MKLVLAIVRDEFAGDVVAALNEKGMSVTRISSTGGFWRRGNVTLVIGLEEDQLDLAMETINANAGPVIEPTGTEAAHPPHRATIFQLGVDAFHHY
ncbi:MAG: hypothetical protein GX557_05130 [Chloroflexi bacterium]|nr:hypothetical protein [Chloroflexota bacterium]